MVADASEESDFAAIQRRMTQAIIDADGVSSPALDDIRPSSLSAARRLAIYRYNVITNLTNALTDLYPVVCNIVGVPFFREAARVFIVSVPSISGNLNDFGEQFGVFLRGYLPAAELPYLADVATIEWQWHRAFHAADGDSDAAMNATSLISRLGELDPDTLPNVCFALHPAVALIQSRFPLFTVWQMNQPDYDGAWEIDWTCAEMVVVHRDGFAVTIRQIDSATFAFLSALVEKKSLAEAFELALNADAQFNLQGFLLSSVQSNIIIDFSSPA
ncbi:MAG: putative DNA-binding domain-containing protein [Betaproteobacteria bacterium]|jgi:hypothetical protein